MNLRSIRIGWRLGLGFGVILGLAVMVLGVEIIISRDLRAEQDRAIRHANAKAVAAEQMRSALLEAGIAMRNVGLQHSTPDMEREKERLRSQQARFAQSAQELAALGLNNEERTILARIEELGHETAPPFQEVERLLSEYAAESAAQLISLRIDPLNRAAAAEIDKLVAMQRRSLLGVLDVMEARGQKAGTLLMSVGLLCIALGALFSTWMTRSITAPLRQAVAIAQQIAAGRLYIKTVAPETDEPGELLQALQNMAEKLTVIVDRVRSGADEIVSSSNRIAAESSDLSQRTGLQASALQETSACMEEMALNVQRNADNAQQADEVVRRAASAASDGNGKVEELVITMAGVEASTQQIDDIICLIDGIAFQTNILALNAAVEAARAGQSGRGFAVVAAEVRTLAERCTHATHEIRDLVGRSVNSIRQGNAIASSAGHKMHELVTSVAVAVEVVAAIAAANKDQSDGILHIERMVASMDDLVKKNAAMVGQAAAAASDMHDMSVRLRRLVDAFQLDQA